MATNFVAKLWQNYYPLHLSLCHSETEWDITTSMCAVASKMMALYCVLENAWQSLAYSPLGTRVSSPVFYLLSPEFNCVEQASAIG